MDALWHIRRNSPDNTQIKERKDKEQVHLDIFGGQLSENSTNNAGSIHSFFADENPALLLVIYGTDPLPAIPFAHFLYPR